MQCQSLTKKLTEVLVEDSERHLRCCKNLFLLKTGPGRSWRRNTKNFYRGTSSVVAGEQQRFSFCCQITRNVQEVQHFSASKRYFYFSRYSGGNDDLLLAGENYSQSGITVKKRRKNSSARVASEISRRYSWSTSSDDRWWGEEDLELVRKMILSDSSRLQELPQDTYDVRPECGSSTNGLGPGDNNEPAVFEPKRVLILSKMSRLEFEKQRNAHLSDSQLEKEVKFNEREKTLKRRGSDYFHLLERHNQHNNYLSAIIKEFHTRNIEHRIVKRWDYTEDALNWADAVFTAGGDGTFLLAASKITNRNKPVIGINTDPISSEGYLCLMKKLPESHFSGALDRLLRGNFKWLWRNRIRVTISGKDMWSDPVELHDQQLMYPEHRWVEHVQEGEEYSRLKGHSTPRQHLPHPLTPQRTPQASEQWQNLNGVTRNGDGEMEERVLPYLALNDVFIGESLSSRVSYYELKVDEGPKVKQKSSGMTVCTGTGSTSWHFNINKLTDQCVSDLMKIMGEDLKIDLPDDNKEIVSRLCKRFNDQLLFPPSDLRMAFTVRDPVYNATFKPIPPRGFAQTIRVKSRCFDAHLVIDGGMSYIFNDGAKAKLEMKPEDALRTVIFR